MEHEATDRDVCSSDDRERTNRKREREEKEESVQMKVRDTKEGEYSSPFLALVSLSPLPSFSFLPSLRTVIAPTPRVRWKKTENEGRVNSLTSSHSEFGMVVKARLPLSRRSK